MEPLLILLAVLYALLPIVCFIMILMMRGRLRSMEEALTSLRSQGVQTGSATQQPEAPQQPATQPETTPQETISEPVEEPADEDEQDEEPAKQPDALEDMIAASVAGDNQDEQSGEASDSQEQEPPRKLDLENLIGARWSTLLGGATLALGIIFLVRHSIEAGLLGPGARITLGALFSIALFGAGELLRRSDRHFNLPINEKADVPGILTGAGAIGAFATLYAAYALYGFIGPGVAFVGLTVVGLGSLLLSSVHGPKLAALGVLGAYAAPLLVSTQDPNPIALALHVIVVTASVMAVARVRGWRWLAIAGALASTVWIVLAAPIAATTTGVASLMMVVAIAFIFTATWGWHGKLLDEPSDEKTDRLAIIAFTLLCIAFTAQLLINYDLPDTATALISALIIMGGASLFASIGGISLAACFIVLIAIFTSDLTLAMIDGLTTGLDVKNNLVPPDTNAFIANAAFLAVPPALVALWGAWRSALLAPRHAGWLASAVSTLAFFALLFAYLRIAPFETRPMFGLMGVLLAGGLTFVTELFIRRDPEDKTAPAPAAFAVGAVACLSFAIAVSFDVGWMPLAFALSTIGIVGIYLNRPVKVLPWLALASSVLCGISLWFNMPLEMPDISTTLVFNGLLLLLAVPAIALIASGELLRTTGSRIASPAITAIGLAIGALFVGLELVHLINGGDLKSAEQSLAETSAHALAAMGFAWGLQRIAVSTRATIYHYASYIVGIASVGLIALGLFVIYNPLLTGDSIGSGAFFNLLLPGYLLTGLLAAAVALYSRGVRPRWYNLMYAALGGTLLFTYASLMLRMAFQGENIGLFRSTSDLEFWLYSPLWLGLGALILAVGLKLKSTPIRIASGIVIALTIVKVFLLDMSALTGALRAFSFIGLGLSLIVIGRFYQRILLRSSSSASSQEEDGS